MGNLLNRDAILKHTQLKTEDIQAFGGMLRVRELTAAERDSLESSVSGKKSDMQNLRARVVAMAAVDEEGNNLFKTADALALGHLSAESLDKAFWVILRLSGMRPNDVEQMTENFT